jgi:hypothetical protein
VANALRQETGVEVELIDGNWGEFKVLVDGYTVAKKGWFFKPSVEKVLKAVRETGRANSF